MASWCIFIFVIVIGTGRCITCDCVDPNVDNVQTCESLFNLFQEALLSDGGNIYKLRNLMYPSMVAPPELANITYLLKFTDARSAKLPNTSGELPSCPEDVFGINGKCTSQNGTCTCRFGWTVIGIYALVPPALLARLQLQLPFFVMRFFLHDGIPFLWNGYNQLPSTTLNLTIHTDKLTCLSDLTKVDGALMRLTSYVSGSLGVCMGIHFANYVYK